MMDDVDKQWVILVDDDEDDRFLIQQAFRRWNDTFVLQTFQHSQDLFDLLNESAVLPSLILLDWTMSGIEMLRHLRAQPQYASIALIILTTSAQAADHRQARSLGANHFFTKSSSVDQLYSLMTQLRVGLE